MIAPPGVGEDYPGEDVWVGGSTMTHMVVMHVYSCTALEKPMLHPPSLMTPEQHYGGV